MNEINEEVVVEPVIDPIAEKEAEIAKLTAERDNYKAVALARKGKLPADSELLGEDFDVFLDEKIKTVLADKEISRAEREKEEQYQKTLRENAELKLSLKNRPTNGLGGGAGSDLEVKDNVFSPEQLTDLRKRAERLKADPEKFIENAKKNFQKNSLRK